MLKYRDNYNFGLIRKRKQKQYGLKGSQNINILDCYVDDLKRIVSKVTNADCLLTGIKSRRKSDNYANILISQLLHESGASAVQIKNILNYKDHSTILNRCLNHRAMMQYDPQYINFYNTAKFMLGGDNYDFVEEREKDDREVIGREVCENWKPQYSDVMNF